MGVAYDLNALSGINAASNGLAVISNNLANSQSVGFKSSRAEFADMFAGAQNSPGNGVRVAAITQDFSQGTVSNTGRELDMAINGEGFFILEDKSGKYDNVYSRNGSFKLDKDGFLTSQEGNRVQGYLLDPVLSTESKPVFETTLSSIDLDALNREPKATDEMIFNINLDGQAPHNVSPTMPNNTDNNTDNSIGSSENLVKLLQPANGTFDGSPDYVTKKEIYDSLGGVHVLNTSFYKRDVVPLEDSAGNPVSDTDAQGNSPALTTPVKYTSWLVQYNITDNKGDLTANVSDALGAVLQDGAGNPYQGQVFEMRYDTNGNLLGVYQPSTAGVYDPTGITATSGGVADADLAAGAEAAELPAALWEKIAGAPTLNFVVNNPLTGATDPLGGAIPGTPGGFDIKLDFEEMSQFAGSYNLRGVTQNGFKIGDLVGLSTGLDGTIEARYSNGRSIPVAKLGIANFSDKNAMEKLGGQTYAETFSSGPVQLGQAQNNGFGTVNAGSLEYSNVDVAGELINMIQMQRTYQASAQVISTSQQLTQTVLQL